MFGKLVGRLGVVGNLTKIQRAIRAIRALFAAGTQGAWYDPSDLTTLSQDSAGTTPVTAVEQPVGLMLDKSGRGNHATQVTTANRPVLSSRVNLFTESEFRNGVTDAAIRGGLLTATTLTGYAGALAFGYDGTIGTFAYKAPFTAAIGQVYTMSVVVAMTDGLAPVFGSATESSVLNVFALAMAGDAQSPTTYTVTDLGGGFYRVSGARTATTASANFGVVKYPTNSSRTFKVTAYHLDLGATATRYQRVNTASDYDTAGFPKYLKFNGVNSSMSTAATNFTATDKMMVCAGVGVLNSAIGMIAELSVNMNGNPGSFYSVANENANKENFKTSGTLSPPPVYVPTAITPPRISVLTGLGDIAAPSIVLRRNGAQVASSTETQGTGNFGNYPLYIGSRAGTSLFFNGNIYGLLILGVSPSAAQINSSELYMNSKTGAY